MDRASELSKPRHTVGGTRTITLDDLFEVPDRWVALREHTAYVDPNLSAKTPHVLVEIRQPRFRDLAMSCRTA
jgi:hypothetical protein